MARYTPNKLGTRRYLQHNPVLKATLHRRAMLGLAAATPLVPRRTGELAASGEVTDDGPNGGVHGDRMQFSIRWTVRHAVPVSFDEQNKQNHVFLEVALAVMERGR